jgi:hypothetical protein
MGTAVKKMDNIKRINPCKIEKSSYNKTRTNVLYYLNQTIREFPPVRSFLAGRFQWI